MCVVLIHVILLVYIQSCTVYMYISQNNEWLILLFCSSPWCIHWLSKRFSPQLWRFVIKMSNLACFFLSFGAGSFWHLKRKKSCWEKNVVVYFIFLKESDVVINMLNCLLMCVFWWILRNIWYDNLKNIFFLSVHGESNPQQLCTTGKGNNSCLFHALPNTSMNEWCKLNSISLYAWW